MEASDERRRHCSFALRGGLRVDAQLIYLIRPSERDRNARKNPPIEVVRDSNTGVWFVHANEQERRRGPHHLSALPRYLTAFDSLARSAQNADEAQFVLALIGVKGLQDAGWDPYETTIDAIKATTRLHNEADDPLAQRHLELWIYGHIVEASAPYEFLANLARICVGHAAQMTWWDERSRLVSPNKKIRDVGLWAAEAGNQAIGYLLQLMWNRQLRNAIFHSDYSLHGDDLRFPGSFDSLSSDQLAVIAGHATACHEAAIGIRNFYRRSYGEPKRVSSGEICPGSDEELIVLVREGDGAVGLRHALTPAELASGGIRFRYAKLYPDEIEMLDDDSDLAMLPPRPPSPSPKAPPDPSAVG